ncbi:MAG: hypothetical protein GY765_25565, partial [bacterium]|nr:hypothetical protein [bacterium]
FSSRMKLNYNKILLLNLVLIIIGIVFSFFKKVNKKWVQFAFMVVLLINILNSFSTVISGGRVEESVAPAINAEQYADGLDGGENRGTAAGTDEYADTGGRPTKKFVPRKIRIVIMEGLSLQLLYDLAPGQKMLNFNEMIKKGSCGKILGYAPNLGLSLINSALTGLKPSQFNLHSDTRYKFKYLEQEFEVKPRFIFFRKAALFDITSFYIKEDNYVLDHINAHYEGNKRRTVRFIHAESPPTYSEGSLRKNNRFVPLFPGVLNKKNEKYDILKKAFFYDDYLLNSMRRHWNDADVFYSVDRFPGLGLISKYFYQYHDPSVVGNVPEADIKKYGRVIEKYYEYYASIVGNLISITGEKELLVIVSFFEYEPLPVWRRIILNLFDQKEVYVYKALNSQGTILLYEKNALKKDYPLKAISIYDIFPTLLYYSGFRLPKNMEGEVIREIFTDDFALTNPIDIRTD